MTDKIPYVCYVSTTTIMEAVLKNHDLMTTRTLPNEPEIIFSSKEISIAINCFKEYQFSISDLQGRLLQKAVFKEKTSINITEFKPGRYEIVIFNDCDLFRKPFRID